MLGDVVCVLKAVAVNPIVIPVHARATFVRGGRAGVGETRGALENVKRGGGGGRYRQFTAV